MRVAVLSDIHANLVALRAVLERAGAVDAIWSLGDTVGYGPEPDGCVNELRARRAVAVAGNHDWAAVGKLSTRDFNPFAAEAVQWTERRITAETREYLLSLPQRRTQGEYTLVHGSPRDPIWEYVLDDATAAENFAHFRTRSCLIGHTHVPSYFVLAAGEVEIAYARPGTALDLDRPGARYILNPGSVGQPRDRDPDASFLLLDTDAARAEWRRVSYDIAATQTEMATLGLPGPLIERLAEGR